MPLVTQAACCEAGIDWASLNLSPVPEPETYAMMLAGLGFVARRKKAMFLK